MGRPERPVDHRNGPVAAFAVDLRARRNAAGLTYRQMAKLVHFSVPTLSSAAAGREPPTWMVLSAYLAACGVDDAELATWRSRWMSLTSRESDATPTVETGTPGRRLQDPDHVRTSSELAAALNIVRGDLSYQQLTIAARKLPSAGSSRRGLPASTVSDLLRHGRTSRETLTTYLAVCQVPVGAWAAWISAWERSRARQYQPPLAVVEQPPGTGTEDDEEHAGVAGASTAITVAAIDNHPIVLHGLQSLLAAAPGVTVVATARTVDELLIGPGRHAEIVLLEPDLGDGSVATDNIRDLLAAGAKVVVLSAVATPEAVRAAVRAGASGYVPKAENVDDLMRAIEDAAAGGSWVSPQLAFALLTDADEDRPHLSSQETEALKLYAAGLPLKTVGRQMGVSQDTAKQYLDRVRAKYRRAGREAGTKIDLYRRAVEDRHLPR